MSALAVLTVVLLAGPASSSVRTGTRARARARAGAGPGTIGVDSDSGLGLLARGGTAVTRKVVGLVRRLRGSTGRDDLDHALVLETVARPLRAGASLMAAVDEALAELPASVAARDLARAMASVRAGASLAVALERWSTSDPAPGRAAAGTALVLAAELGGAPSRPLEQAASGLRDRAALAGEVRALSSQARASAAVMVLGPPVFLVVATMMDRRLAHVLFATPAGLGCLVVGAALDLAGTAWMARLVERVS
jgi:tight adherence protein B